MLPLPRPRPDAELVRARLRALAQGAWGELPAPDPDPDLDDTAEARELAGAVVRTRAPLRIVVLAVGATALATWTVLRLTTGGAPSPVQLLPGTPVPTSSSGSVAVAAGPGSPGSASLGRASPEPGGAAPSLSVPAPTLVVQVVGEVRHAGLVRLPTGARVADAVAAAGGLARGGSSGGLNLARPVVDGEQIVVSGSVPVQAPGTTTPASSASGAGAVVDLNSATTADLDTLPGVGPVMAARILDWRSAHGRFASVDQLKEVSGIGARTFDRLRPHVRV